MYVILTEVTHVKTSKIVFMSKDLDSVDVLGFCWENGAFKGYKRKTSMNVWGRDRVREDQ